MWPRVATAEGAVLKVLMTRVREAPLRAHEESTMVVDAVSESSCKHPARDLTHHLERKRGEQTKVPKGPRARELISLRAQTHWHGDEPRGIDDQRCNLQQVATQTQRELLPRD